MSESSIAGLPESFWSAVKESHNRLLMLDYDGTLAPFVAERDRAFPYPGVAELLAKILKDDQSRLVIVTGRAIEDIPQLLSLDPLPETWGCHGWERLSAAGELTRLELPEASREALDRAWRWGCAAELDEQLERKPFSVAIHWRGLDAVRRDEISLAANQAWAPIAEQGGMVLHPFDGGLELRSPGRNKGDVVHDLLAESAPQPLAVYLGDDLTDEDAFRALPSSGSGILVRREYRPTAASYWLKPPEQLIAFLQAWLDACRYGEFT